MKLLLAGPGTGKTSKIKSLLQNGDSNTNVLILSFTNATIDDLQQKLAGTGVSEKNCMTLHKFAVKYNHDRSRHVLLQKEIDELKQVSKSTDVSFDALCDFLSCTTFNQMIGRFVSYAKTNEAYLKDKLGEYQMLIVDEYQDFNPHEQALIDILIEIIPDAYILGDDDQCIYDFKDASNEKIIAFYNDGNNEKMEHEHKCHRCPDKVVEHASILIKRNTKRIDKKWEKSGKAGELTYKQLTNFAEVGSYVANKIKEITQKNQNDSILVLSPVQFATTEVVKKLEGLSMPFTNYFTDRVPEDLIMDSWKLRALFGNYRYANLVFLGYKHLSSRRVFYDLLKKHFEKGKDFEELFTLLTSKLPEEVKRSYQNVAEALGAEVFKKFTELYDKAEGDTEDEKLENLFRVIEDIPDEKVKIMSIHKSKGLDADHVFMIGLVEGIIPNKKGGTDVVEGYRRQFYVGMTRAKVNLHLISNYKVEGRFANLVNKSDFTYNYLDKFWHGRASSFIEELGI